MKTTVEKIVLGMIIVIMLLLIARIPSCFKTINEMERVGLKTIVNEIWEGKEATKQGNR